MERGLLNDPDAIAQIAEAQPEEAAYRLHLKTNYLRETDNGRGEGILSGERYKEFLKSIDRE